MSFELRASLRRLRPEKIASRLKRRDDAALPFARASTGGPPLLLDTTVYIDSLQDRLPDHIADLVRIRAIQHSSLAIAELMHGYARLDPRHAGTANAQRAICSLVDAIPARRLHAPSVRTTIEAGLMSGVLARALHLPKTQPKLLVDAILFLQSFENGCHLLSRNIGDMDLLLQMIPAGRVLLYRQVPGANAS